MGELVHTNEAVCGSFSITRVFLEFQSHFHSQGVLGQSISLLGRFLPAVQRSRAHWQQWSGSVPVRLPEVTELLPLVCPLGYQTTVQPVILHAVTDLDPFRLQKARNFHKAKPSQMPPLQQCVSDDKTGVKQTAIELHLCKRKKNSCLSWQEVFFSYDAHLIIMHSWENRSLS